MSIPKNIGMAECVGRYATLDREIMNGAGQIIPKGSTVKIVGTGRSLSIETQPCKICGQRCYIRNIKKSDMTLIDDADKKSDTDKDRPVGKWINVQYGINTGVWRAECSVCGYICTEIHGSPSAIHKYCENCGSKMVQSVPQT